MQKFLCKFIKALFSFYLSYAPKIFMFLLDVVSLLIICSDAVVLVRKNIIILKLVLNTIIKLNSLKRTQVLVGLDQNLYQLFREH